MDTRIYVMTHKQYTKPKDDLYEFLHVGRELGEDLGYTGDNTGDNISIKNKNYCELTGIYWLWKNVDCDVVGVCHYRRYFVHNEDFISKETIEEILKNYDIIVPDSAGTNEKNLLEHYKKKHHIYDMEICRQVIHEKYPEYDDAFSLCMECNLFSLGNMIITRKEIFDSYCQWLFSILFEVEKRVDIRSYDDYQKRIFGYLSERLLRVWLLNSHYKILEEKVLMINPEDSYNAEKAVELKYKYAKLVLKDIIEKYQTGKSTTIPHSTPMDIDFQGKLPVWLCWWQGLDAAPDLVKVCVSSIVENIPADKAQIHLITFENVNDYVTFPDWIVDKFNSGKISMTHLSDILRAGLLYRYGGLWMDATYYMNSPLPDIWFEKKGFYTQRLKKPMWRADLAQNRWTGNLLKMEPGNMLAGFMLEAFYEYWRLQDKLINYDFIDDVICAAYDYVPSIRAMIEECEYSQPEIFSLAPLLNKKYSDEIFKKLTKETQLFKLSYKNQLQTTNVVGDKTFYGFLLDNVI